METQENRALGRSVLAMDAVMVVAAMPPASWLHALVRQHLHLFKDPPSLDQFAVLPFLTIPLFLAWTAGLGLHRLRQRAWNSWRLFADVLKLHVAVLLSLSVLIFFSQSIVNRSLIGLFLACTFTLLFLERVALTAWLRYQHAKGVGRERLLVAGGESVAMLDFVQQAGTEPYGPLLVGRLVPDAEPPVAPSASKPHCLGQLSDLERVLQEEAVDHVLFFPPLHHPANVMAALDCCEQRGVPASFHVDLPRPTATMPRLMWRGRLPFFTFDVAPKSASRLAIKHGTDVLCAALGIILLGPLLGAIALMILVTMGRPVLFVQERAGLFGRRFRMLKFRTMERGAEAGQEALRARNELSGPVFKLSSDPRVTRLGWALRRSSLDELPQLINILLGQMSLVGPRPLPLDEQKAIKGWQRRRLSMKPGLTGLWQVSGRSGVDFDEWMRLDLDYIDRWTLGLDLLIVLQTIPAVLLGRGAR